MTIPPAVSILIAIRRTMKGKRSKKLRRRTVVLMMIMDRRKTTRIKSCMKRVDSMLTLLSSWRKPTRPYMKS